MGNKNLGGAFSTAKHIGPEVSASDSTISDGLKGGPVFGLDQRFLAQPLRDRLLAQGRSLKNAGETGGKSGLAPGDLDGATKGGNVRFIHEHPLYTTQVVRVNNLSCVQAGPQLATVLPMPAMRKKEQPRAHEKPKRVRVAARGPDGRTLGERLEVALQMYALSRGVSREEYTQDRIIAEATRAVQRDPEKDPVITQQGLSLILTNQTGESPAAVALARFLGVEAVWLQYGVGPPSALARILEERK